MSRIAFIGLGVMGYPMAGHLAGAGHAMTVYNRTFAKAEAWHRAHGGALARTPAAAARGAECVISCVGNDDDLRSVLTGPDGALAALVPGTVIVDHTTTSAEVAREMAAAARARDIAFIDAPVSGGQAGAEQGALTIMGGGEASAWQRVEPVLGAYSKSRRLMGPTGHGQLTKMVNQICVAGVVQGLAEGLNFGLSAGLDMTAAIEVISKGAAQSWQMDHRASSMLAGQFDFGFAVDWMRKDLGIVLDEARRNGAELPVTALIDQFYAELQRRGGNRQDTSSLIRRLRSS